MANEHCVLYILFFVQCALSSVMSTILIKITPSCSLNSVSSTRYIGIFILQCKVPSLNIYTYTNQSNFLFLNIGCQDPGVDLSLPTVRLC